ncbi:hypothetical protein [Herbaspirillum sp. RV1423]|uniref:hypothetical protein n=1 Tax=Herbaspirillum sp. RV1423 TaxID=1443993 RepID=UPI00068435C6|nr:hypothetical protein [Herbaspirillum sp. RV1423]
MEKEDLICQAILEKRVISFYYDGHHRKIEPHVYGVCKGNYQLFGYQVEGKSNSDKPLGWRRFDVAEIAYLRITEVEFPDSRLNSNLKNWDRPIAIID